MPRIPTADQLADIVLGLDDDTMPGPASARTDRGILTGVVASSFSGSGLIPVQWDFETSAGTKLYPGLKVYLFSVGDKVMGVPVGSSYVVIPFGTPTAPSTVATDSPKWKGTEWIEPGTTTTAASANTEQTTSSTSAVTVKRFYASHFGRYRVTADLHRGAGAATVTLSVKIKTPTGDLISAGSTTGSAASYTAASADMTQIVAPGMEIVIQLQTSNGASAAFIQNCSLKYQNATATPTGFTAAVLQD